MPGGLIPDARSVHDTVLIPNTHGGLTPWTGVGDIEVIPPLLGREFGPQLARNPISKLRRWPLHFALLVEEFGG